jgi:hypothetical protein
MDAVKKMLKVPTIAALLITITLVLNSCTTLYYSYKKPMSKGSKATFVNYPAIKSFGDPITLPVTKEQQANYIEGMSLPGKPQEYQMIFVPPGKVARGYAYLAINCDPEDNRPTTLNRDDSYQSSIGSTNPQLTKVVDAPCSMVPVEYIEGRGNNQGVAIILHETYGCDLNDLTTLDLMYLVPIIMHIGAADNRCIGNANDSVLLSRVLSRCKSYIMTRVSETRASRNARESKYLSYADMLVKVKTGHKDKEINQWWDAKKFASAQPSHDGVVASDDDYAGLALVCNNLAYLGGLSQVNRRYMQYYLYSLNAWARSALSYYRRDKQEGLAAIYEVSSILVNVATRNYPIKLDEYKVALSDAGELLAVFDELQYQKAKQGSGLEFSDYDELIINAVDVPKNMSKSYVSLVESLLSSMYYRDYRKNVAYLFPAGSRPMDNPKYDVYAEYADSFVTYAGNLLTKEYNLEVEKQKKEQADEDEKKAKLELGTTVYFELQLNSRYSSGLVTIEGVKIKSYGRKSEIQVVRALPKYDGYGDPIHLYGKKPLEPGQTFILAPNQFRLSLFR